MIDPGGISAQAVTVKFPRAKLASLSSLDLDVQAGQRLLVLGPSGSGKSTLLRVLAGIVPHSVHAAVSGAVSVAGHDVLRTSVAELARRVATVTQNPADQLCLPEVVDEVAFGLENRRVPVERIEDRVHNALARMGAGHLRGRRTGTLSGGEAQRVALAAALVAEPSVLLLDEPSALLDPDGVAEVGHAISSGIGAASGGQPPTVVLVEHRLDELPWLPERVLVLDRDGTVLLDGARAAVFREYASELTALGSWLPLEAELQAATGHPGGLECPHVAAALRRLAGTGSCPDRASRTTSATGVVLRASSMCVRYGQRHILDGVDLALRAGEVTAVLGVNGSGKTSLLLGLAALVPTTGTVTCGSVGMVFQQPEHQFLGRTVREDIGYGLRRPGSGRPREHDARVEARIDAALEQFHLSGVAGTDPFRLSGGQQRRLSLAAMAVLDHEVLLADEPTFGQDHATSAAIAAALEELARDGRSVVVATHDLRLAARIADRVLILARGRILAAGPAELILGNVALMRDAGVRLPRLLGWIAAEHLPCKALVTAVEENSVPPPSVMADSRSAASEPR